MLAHQIKLATAEQIAAAVNALAPYGVTFGNLNRFSRDVLTLAEFWGNSYQSVTDDIVGLAGALARQRDPTPAPAIAAGLVGLHRDHAWRSWRHLLETYALARGQGISHEGILFRLAMA